MENAAGEKVDLYPPRKCSWTNRLITAKDHRSVQISVGDVDPATGRYTGTYKTFAFCGALRQRGESDMALTNLFRKEESA